MGNYSRDDTFDKLKHYVSVRLQQGVPLVDADWNEMEDIRRFELQAFLKWYVGNGIPEGNDGFRIEKVPTISGGPEVQDDFVIKGGTQKGAGRCLVEGWDVINDSDLKYTDQRLYKETDLFRTWKVAPLPPLTKSNTMMMRYDTVYLDVWEREVDSTEDENLKNTAIGIETCVRLKREWVVRVAEYTTTLPDAPANHVFYDLAFLIRYPNLFITDNRKTVLSLASLSAEVSNAKGDTTGLASRLDVSLLRNGMLRADVVGNDQIKKDANIAESKILFSDKGHDHSSGKGALIGMESLQQNVRSNLVDLDRAFNVPLLRQTVFHVQNISCGTCKGVAFDGTHIWVADISNKRVIKIDVTSNVVLEKFDMQASPCDLAFDGSSIWVTNSDTSSRFFSKINVTKNTVDHFPVDSVPVGLAFDGTYIWMTNCESNTVSKIDITSNAVVKTFPVQSYPWALAFDGTHIWVANMRSDSVSKIKIDNTDTTEPLQTVGVQRYPCALAFDGTHIWAASFYGESVTKIDVDTNTVVATVRNQSRPCALTFDGTSIWVAHDDSQSVSRIDIHENLAIDYNINIGEIPNAMAFDGLHLWITRQSGLAKLRVRL